ncbi:MAG TPA: SLAC1 anion channel family protein, partial [Albitalea sp.]|nr:SLAC1 anion channel family protein [Albitalea sp.]
MSHHPTPLKFLIPGWFTLVMGLSGLALAWQRATPFMGDLAGAGALVLGGVAALVFVLLAGLSLLRWQRYPQALADDLKHPVRHAFVAAVPVSLILLATVAVGVAGASPLANGLWWLGSVMQLWVTVWVLGRWLSPGKGLSWPAITPVLIIPVVGNVLAPLAGVALGHAAWSAAQLGIGVLLWPVLLALLAVRIGTTGLWPERLLPTTFITIAPPAVIGVALLELGAPLLFGWAMWGLALFFALWSAQLLRRSVSQPFGLPFWGLSFPLAAWAGLTLRLATEAQPAFQTLATLLLAMATLVIAALVLATVKGLRDGSLLAPEPVATLTPVA